MISAVSVNSVMGRSPRGFDNQSCCVRFGGAPEGAIAARLSGGRSPPFAGWAPGAGRTGDLVEQRVHAVQAELDGGCESEGPLVVSAGHDRMRVPQRPQRRQAVAGSLDKFIEAGRL